MSTRVRTGWFLESVISATLVVLIVRTRRPLLKSMPGRWLLWATLGAIFVAASLPWLPWSDSLGFAPVPATVVAAVALIVLGYVISAEAAKAVFYRKMLPANGPQPHQSGSERGDV